MGGFTFWLNFLLRLRGRPFGVACHDSRSRQRLQRLAARGLIACSSARYGKRQRRRKTAYRRRRIVRTQSGESLHSQSRRRGRKRRCQTIRELTRTEDIVIAVEIG